MDHQKTKIQIIMTLQEAETILEGEDPDVDEQDAWWKIEEFWSGKDKIRKAVQNYYKRNNGGSHSKMLGWES
jgi:hypothetical protein